MACALALAEIARLPVPNEVRELYPDRDFTFGANYVIPTPFDPRLIQMLPVAVAKAAMESGVAKKNIYNLGKYSEEIWERINKETKGPLRQLKAERIVYR